MLLLGDLKQHEYSIFTPAYILLHSANFIQARNKRTHCVLLYWYKKEEIWLSPMPKAHALTEMSKGQNDNTNNATKKLVYTAIVDWLRTVSLK